MNLLEFLKKAILKIKQKSDETYLAKNDPTANVQVKDLTAKNLDLSYTAEDGSKKTGKVKSDVTPYNDETQNLGSSEKIWKTFYLLSDGFKMRTKIPDPNTPGKFLTVKPFAIDKEGNLQIYFPGTGNFSAVTISKDNHITIYDPISKQKILKLFDGHIEMFGSVGEGGNQKKSFSLDTNLHRLDFESDTGVLSTADEFIIIPDHGVFTTNSLESSRYNRIKFGGVEQTHFDADADANISEEVIFSYKRAGTSTDDIPDVAITKAGIFYYKGKKLEDYPKLYLHTINMGNGYSGNDILFSFYATRKTVFSSFEEVANYFLDANVGRNNTSIAPNPFQVNVISAMADGTNAYPMIAGSACFKRINGVPVLATSITTEIDGVDFQPVIYHYSHNFVYETDEDAGYFYSSCVEV